MSAMLHALTLTGFSKEAAEIETRWNELLIAANSKPDPDYRRCFPNRILETMAEKALAGVKSMNCRIAELATIGTVHSTLNQAWIEFWRSPADYAEWEKTAVETLRQECMKITS
jgi:hypothetical protein